jgi:RNA polymerase sigma-70 factor, ECF subfamily
VLDEEARLVLERAYRSFAPDLWRVIYAYCGGVGEVADEAVAEAFAQAGRALGGIRDLRPWLYVAAFRIASGELKRRRRLVSLDQVPEKRMERGSTESSEAAVARLLELLRTISPNQRGTFVLREVYGYSSTETARLLGISEVAVRVHLHAARSRLRAKLQEVER